MEEKEATVIGGRTKVKGLVSGNEQLLIHGVVEGDVQVNGTVDIAPSGTVTGNITASMLSVKGQVEGDVSTEGLMEMGEGSTVRGNIKAARVRLADGAFFNGSIEMPVVLPEGI